MKIPNKKFDSYIFMPVRQSEDISLKDFYEYTVRQVEIELHLIDNRLSWMLTFQGFLFTTIALLSNGTADPKISQIFEDVIPCFGIVVALLALVGVIAAYRAFEALKDDWKRQLSMHLGETTRFPRAFGPPQASKLGKITSHGIPISIACTWLILRAYLSSST